MEPKKIVYLVIGFLMLIVLLQNTQIVTVNLFFWQISMSRIILLLLLFIMGFVSGYMVNYRMTQKKKDAGQQSQ